jgi:hypothetical protein
MEAKHIIIEHAILPADKLPEDLHNGVINMFNWYNPDSCHVKLHTDGKSIVLYHFESGMYNIIFCHDVIEPIAQALKVGGRAMGMIKGIKKVGDKIILMSDWGIWSCKNSLRADYNGWGTREFAVCRGHRYHS